MIIDHYIKENKIDNWFAPADIGIGRYYADGIPEAIQECLLFLLIASKHSVGSRQGFAVGSQEVIKELALAVESRRHIVPLMIDKALEDPGNDCFKYHFSVVQRLDVSEKPLQEQVDITVHHIARLLKEHSSGNRESFGANEAFEASQRDKIERIERVLKAGDTPRAQRLLKNDRFQGRYADRALLLNVIATMIENDIKHMPIQRVRALLDQLDMLKDSEYESTSLYLKSIFSLAYFKTNCLYDASGGFEYLQERASKLPKIPVRYICMTQYIKGAENAELRWAQFRKIR